MVAAGAFPNLTFSYHGRCNRRLKEKFAALYAHYFGDVPPGEGSGLGDRKRIGVVVTQRHEGIFLRCNGRIWRRLDRERFELVVLCSHSSIEPLRRGLRRKDIRFIGFPPSLAEAVARVRESRCDLLYYWAVGSDALNYLLPFARPAPVQCTSHGSQITSGVPAVDWFYSSRWLENDAAEGHYTERLWRSDALLIDQPRLPPPDNATRGAFGLPDDRALYLCFQNPLKLHPDFDPLLAELLRRNPRGLVVLLAGWYSHVADALKARFAAALDDVAARVVFLPWQKSDDYCRLVQLADVVLDPPHFGAGSSAYDLFSFNRPVVTMAGELIVGRVAAGFYKRLGLDDLIAAGPEQYVSSAVRLGTDSDYRHAVEQRIAAASDVLFDDTSVVAKHERFFGAVLGRTK